MLEWAGLDSNQRSLRSRFTACPLCPLGYRPGAAYSIRPPVPRSQAIDPPETKPCPRSTSCPSSTCKRCATPSTRRQREISTRFDFKNTGSSIELKEKEIELATESEGRLTALTQVLEEKLVKRQVSLKALGYGKVEEASKGTVRQTVTLNVGISTDKAKEIGKFIKELGLKGVSHQIQGDQLRVSGKKRDDLQAAIAAMKDHDFAVPLQFTNFRD